MDWSWQLPDWPEFKYDPEDTSALEAVFLRECGRVVGAFTHLDPAAQEALKVDLLSDEAIKSSRIEGEILDRESVQSSIRRNLGLQVDRLRAVKPAEQGIADLLVDVYRTYEAPLSHEVLHRWHRMLMAGQLEGGALGNYRRGDDPMQIVTGDPFDPEVHFEAPPSSEVPREMERFVDWFNTGAGGGARVPLPALARGAIAHLYFETIHPFADGNGRIGRALAEKVLSQAAGQPILASLSQTIEANRKQYYAALAETRFTNEITGWVRYFAETVLLAIQDSLERVEFLIAKVRFFDRHETHLNVRQEKVLLRIFREGKAGFQGGLSAGNYLSITKTSPATARRDLAALVKMGALTRTGERKGTRYSLRLPPDP
jgi:Fic family protein